MSRELTRRAFVRTGVAGGATGLLAPLVARVEAAARPVTGLAPPGNTLPPAVPAFALDEVTIAQLQEGMQSGRWSARSVTDQYLARIAAIDASGPAINSVIELNPDAQSIADALDAERRARGPRGPLHGVPVLIKDNIDTADRMATTAGSLALVGPAAPADAAVARKLREAGAVILGKTNPSEWADFRSSHATSGWSGRGGLTRNPYALDRNPCGSSSGSGAAVSANLCALAIGTETDGSIVCPSSANGIVGIKPTVGLVSRTGIIPIAHSQDSAGPMCRTVRDAAVLLGALVGVDPLDAATEASRGHARTDYTGVLDPAGLRGARIGVVRKYFGFNDGVDALMETALATLARQGATLVDPADIATIGETTDSESTVLLYEFKADLHAYLTRRGPGPVRTLADIIAFNEQERAREMPYFGQDLLVKAEAVGPLTSPAYRRALATDHRLARTEGIDAVMRRHTLDALVAPTGGPAWLTDLLNGDNSPGQTSSAAAVAGYPSVSVPAGQVGGLPVGLSFIGRAWSEPILLRLAYAFEQATHVRTPPTFLPHLPASA